MRALVFVLGLLLAGCDARAPETRPRLLIVGWDGASFRMIDRLLADGKLPTVQRMIDTGVQAELASTIIPISSAAWTSAVTGKGPGDTGVYEFFEPIEGTYDVRLISSRSNRATPIWRILTRRGKRSIVFGVPVTYPPEPIFGTMVAGMLSPFGAAYAYPPELTDELRAQGFEPDLDAWTEARPISWEYLDQQLRIKARVLVDLLEADDWDFAMLVFKSLDVVSHLAYEQDFYEHTGAVYEQLDLILAELLARAGPDTNVILMSDHGFTEYTAGFNLHAWLVHENFAVKKDRVKQFTVGDHETLTVRERARIMQTRNELDWTLTRAFATMCEGNYGTLRLNVKGREPAGTVLPGDTDAVLEEIEAELRALKLPDGRLLVTDVFRGAELYPGPHREVIPDLLFETVPDYEVFLDASEPGLMGVYPEESPRPEHDRMGIFVASGPSFRHVAERGRADIADVAPTALHLLGQPVYAEMTGQVLEDWLRGMDAPRLLAEADDPLARGSTLPPGEPFTEKELAEIQERLDDLGYTDG